MSEIPRPPFRTPCQYCGSLIPANGVCPRCAPSDDHDRLEADLAALREAAQAVVDRDAPFDDELDALRAVLASADSESREET